MNRLITILVLVVGLAGCKSQQTEQVQTPGKAVPDPKADEAVYAQAAQNLIGQFSRALQGELIAALNASGPAYAMEICRIKAPQIAAAHSRDNWAIKRVSERFRNPQNRADTTEMNILTRFADPAYEQDSYQEWHGPDSARSFRYCQKIQVRQMCLQCHGDLQTLDGDLYGKVKMVYPWDKATGYREGDLRGMFVVEATWPAGKDMAQLLASGADITQVGAPDSAAAPQ